MLNHTSLSGIEFWGSCIKMTAYVQKEHHLEGKER